MAVNMATSGLKGPGAGMGAGAPTGHRLRGVHHPHGQRSNYRPRHPRCATSAAVMRERRRLPRSRVRLRTGVGRSPPAVAVVVVLVVLVLVVLVVVEEDDEESTHHATIRSAPRESTCHASSGTCHSSSRHRRRYHRCYRSSRCSRRQRQTSVPPPPPPPPLPPPPPHPPPPPPPLPLSRPWWRRLSSIRERWKLAR